MKIKMKTTAAGPDGSFHAEHVYEVGSHITAIQAKAFVDGRYAVYETAEGEAAPETTSKTSPGSNEPADAVQALLDGFPGKIKAGIEALSNEDLARVSGLEGADTGKKRPWVMKLVEAEIAARTEPKT